MITNQVCRAIMQLLLNRYICLPCGNRPITVAQKFQQQQWLPQVGGAVDEWDVCSNLSFRWSF